MPLSTDDVVTATTLRGVCRDAGLSYNTAKASEPIGGLLKLKDRQGEVWSVMTKTPSKVKGRGGKLNRA